MCESRWSELIETTVKSLNGGKQQNSPLQLGQQGPGLQRVAVTPKCVGVVAPLCALQSGAISGLQLPPHRFTPPVSLLPSCLPSKRIPLEKEPKFSFQRSSSAFYPSLWWVVPPTVGAHSLETGVGTCITPLCAFPLFICCLLLCSVLPWRSQHFSKHYRVVLPAEPFSLFPSGTESHLKKEIRCLVLAGPSWHFFTISK